MRLGQEMQLLFWVTVRKCMKYSDLVKFDKFYELQQSFLPSPLTKLVRWQGLFLLWLTTLSWPSPFKTHAFSKQLSSPRLGSLTPLRLPSSFLFQDDLSLRDLGYCPGIPRRLLDLSEVLCSCWQLLEVYWSSRIPFWGARADTFSWKLWHPSSRILLVCTLYPG